MLFNDVRVTFCWPKLRLRESGIIQLPKNRPCAIFTGCDTDENRRRCRSWDK
jgi:hypothetical protein